MLNRCARPRSFGNVTRGVRRATSRLKNESNLPRDFNCPYIRAGVARPVVPLIADSCCASLTTKKERKGGRGFKKHIHAHASAETSLSLASQIIRGGWSRLCSSSIPLEMSVSASLSLSLSLFLSVFFFYQVTESSFVERNARTEIHARVGHTELDGCPLLFKAACVHAYVPWRR